MIGNLPKIGRLGCHKIHPPPPSHTPPSLKTSSPAGPIGRPPGRRGHLTSGGIVEFAQKNHPQYSVLGVIFQHFLPKIDMFLVPPWVAMLATCGPTVLGKRKRVLRTTFWGPKMWKWRPKSSKVGGIWMESIKRPKWRPKSSKMTSEIVKNVYLKAQNR